MTSNHFVYAYLEPDGSDIPRSEANKTAQNKPQAKKNQSKAQKKAQNRPDLKENRRKALQARWNDPVERAKLLKSRKKPVVKVQND